MYEYIVPQEFNQSDRIGKFTIAQAFILGGGGVIAMFLLTVLSIIWAVIIAIPVAVLMVYLMFKKVNDIPIYEFAFVYIIYKSMPKLLIYRPDNLKDDYWLEDELEIYEEGDGKL
jgi:hypothetical protein